MRARGHGGELWVGYQLAARVADWDFTATPFDPYEISLRLYDLNTFWITQWPMRVLLRMDRFLWQWTVESVRQAGLTAVVIVVGQPAVERRYE